MKWDKEVKANEETKYIATHIAINESEMMFASEDDGMGMGWNPQIDEDIYVEGNSLDEVLNKVNDQYGIHLTTTPDFQGNGFGKTYYETEDGEQVEYRDGAPSMTELDTWGDKELGQAYLNNEIKAKFVQPLIEVKVLKYVDVDEELALEEGYKTGY